MADRLRVAHRSDIHLCDGTDDRARVAFAHARAAMRRHDPGVMPAAGGLLDARSVPGDAVAGLPFGQPSRLATHPGH
jgi:hypothetical protein